MLILIKGRLITDDNASTIQTNASTKDHSSLVLYLTTGNMQAAALFTVSKQPPMIANTTVKLCLHFFPY